MCVCLCLAQPTQLYRRVIRACQLHCNVVQLAMCAWARLALRQPLESMSVSTLLHHPSGKQHMLSAVDTNKQSYCRGKRLWHVTKVRHTVAGTRPCKSPLQCYFMVLSCSEPYYLKNGALPATATCSVDSPVSLPLAQSRQQRHQRCVMRTVQYQLLPHSCWPCSTSTATRSRRCSSEYRSSCSCSRWSRSVKAAEVHKWPSPLTAASCRLLAGVAQVQLPVVLLLALSRQPVLRMRSAAPGPQPRPGLKLPLQLLLPSCFCLCLRYCLC